MPSTSMASSWHCQCGGVHSCPAGAAPGRGGSQRSRGAGRAAAACGLRLGRGRLAYASLQLAGARQQPTDRHRQQRALSTEMYRRPSTVTTSWSKLAAMRACRPSACAAAALVERRAGRRCTVCATWEQRVRGAALRPGSGRGGRGRDEAGRLAAAAARRPAPAGPHPVLRRRCLQAHAAAHGCPWGAFRCRQARHRSLGALGTVQKLISFHSCAHRAPMPPICAPIAPNSSTQREAAA